MGSAFVAQLKGKAAQCSFAVTCPGCAQEVSYQESMVADQLIVGARDPDIQCELIARDSSLPTLADKFEFFQSLENGKMTSQLLGNTDHVASPEPLSNSSFLEPLSFLQAYRATVHPATGMPPFRALRGREMRTALDTYQAQLRMTTKCGKR